VTADEETRHYNLQPAPKPCGYADSPVLQVIGDGEAAYLWIGNNAGNHRCFATLEDATALRGLANRILEALGTTTEEG
jgi:hypothetical protein